MCKSTLARAARASRVDSFHAVLFILALCIGKASGLKAIDILAVPRGAPSSRSLRADASAVNNSTAVTSALVVSLNVTLRLPDGFGLPDGPLSDAELAQALDSVGQVQALAGVKGGSVRLSLSAWAINFKLNVTTLQSAGAQAPGGGGGPSGLNPCAVLELEGLTANLRSLLDGPEESLTSAPSAECLLAPPSGINGSLSSHPLTSISGRRNLLIKGRTWAYLPLSPPSYPPPPPVYPPPPPPPAYPPPPFKHACSAPPGYLDLAIQAKGSANLTALMRAAAIVVNQFTASHPGKACPYRREAVSVSAALHVSYAIAVPSSTSAGAAQSLCASVASQTPAALQGLLGNVAAAVVGQPNCRVNPGDPGGSPPGPSSAPSSGGGSSGASFNLIGAIVGPIVAAVAVAGMILGLMGRKRLRSQDGSGDDKGKDGDKEAQPPPAPGGDDTRVVHSSGGDNVEQEDHPMEGVATWNVGSGEQGGIASDAAAAMDEGRVTEAAPAGQPDRAARGALLQMVSLGGTVAAAADVYARTSSANLEQGVPISASSDDIQCKTTALTQLTAPSMASMSLFPGSGGSGLTSPGGGASTLGGSSDPSLQRWSWASLQRQDQSMTQRQPSAQDGGGISTAAEGEAFPQSQVSDSSLAPHQSDPMLQPPPVQSTVLGGASASALPICGPLTGPIHADANPMLAPLFSAKSTVGAVEAAAAGGGASLSQPLPSCEAYQQSSEYSPSEPPISGLLLDSIPNPPLFSVARPSRSPSLVLQKAAAAATQLQHSVELTAAVAAAVATPPLQDSARLSPGSTLAQTQRLGSENRAGGEGIRAVAGGEGIGAVASDVAAPAGGAPPPVEERLDGKDRGGSGTMASNAGIPAAGSLTVVEQQVLQELLASYAGSGGAAMHASRVVTTVVSVAGPAVSSAPDVAAAATAAVGANASRIPGRAGSKVDPKASPKAGGPSSTNRNKSSTDGSSTGASRGRNVPRRGSSRSSSLGPAAAAAIVRQGSVVTTMSASGVPSAAAGVISRAGGPSAAAGAASRLDGPSAAAGAASRLDGPSAAATASGLAGATATTPGGNSQGTSSGSGQGTSSGNGSGGGDSPAMRDAREFQLGPAASSADGVASAGSAGSALGSQSRDTSATASLKQGVVGRASSESRSVLNLERRGEAAAMQQPTRAAVATAATSLQQGLRPTRVLDLSSPPSAAAAVPLLGSPASSLGLHTSAAPMPPAAPASAASSLVSSAAMRIVAAAAVTASESYAAEVTRQTPLLQYMDRGAAGALLGADGAPMAAEQYRQQQQQQQQLYLGLPVEGDGTSRHHNILNAAFSPSAAVAAAAPSSYLRSASMPQWREPGSGSGAVELGAVASMRLMQQRQLQQQQQSSMQQQLSLPPPLFMNQPLVPPSAGRVSGDWPNAPGQAWLEANPEAYPHQLAGGRSQRQGAPLRGPVQLQQQRQTQQQVYFSHQQDTVTMGSRRVVSPQFAAGPLRANELYSSGSSGSPAMGVPVMGIPVSLDAPWAPMPLQQQQQHIVAWQQQQQQLRAWQQEQQPQVQARLEQEQPQQIQAAWQLSEQQQQVQARLEWEQLETQQQQQEHLEFQLMHPQQQQQRDLQMMQAMREGQRGAMMWQELELQPLHSPEARQQRMVMQQQQQGAIIRQDNAMAQYRVQQQQQRGVMPGQLQGVPSAHTGREVVQQEAFADDNRTMATAWGSMAGPSGGFLLPRQTPAAWGPMEAGGSRPPSYQQGSLQRSTSSPGLSTQGGEQVGQMSPGRGVQLIAAPVMVPAASSRAPAAGLDASWTAVGGARAMPLLEGLPSASLLELQQRQQLHMQWHQPLVAQHFGGLAAVECPAAALMSDLQGTPAAGQQRQLRGGDDDVPLFDSSGLLFGGNSGGGRINSWSADALPRLLQSDEALPRMDALLQSDERLPPLHVLLQSDDAVLPLYTRWMEEDPDAGGEAL